LTQGSIDAHSNTIKDINTSGAGSKLTAIKYAFPKISSDLKCQNADLGNNYQKRGDDHVNGSIPNSIDSTQEIINEVNSASAVSSNGSRE
jgi:hypothetical protein